MRSMLTLALATLVTVAHAAERYATPDQPFTLREAS
jgi:hypothetical protein